VIFYKCIYVNQFSQTGYFSFRKGFTLVIESSGKVQIGRGCFFNNYCSLVARDSIQIGEGTLFGENVKVYDHNHCYNKTEVPIKKQGYITSPVVIGRHCWIASNVVILKGVTIGNNSVIGAGCVIYKNIPDNTVVVNEQKLLYREV